MANLRKQLVNSAHKAVETNDNRSIEWDYSEESNRLDQLHTPWAKRVTCDCSAFLVLLFVWLGLRNPDGSKPPYYTGTELTHGEHIALILKNGKRNKHVYAGMAVVYGPPPGWHTAFIVEVRGRDILTVSMGHQGNPGYVWVNTPVDGPSFGWPVDGRTPQTFLRFNTKTPRKAVLKKLVEKASYKIR